MAQFKQLFTNVEIVKTHHENNYIIITLKGGLRIRVKNT